MTTLYIEEISTDDEGDERNSIGPTKSAEKPNDAISQPTLVYNDLTPCALNIGGGASLTVIKRRAYVFGGCSRSRGPSFHLHCYDLDTNEWIYNISCTGSPPCARYAHTAVASQSKIYIFGGQGFEHLQSKESDGKNGDRKLVSFNSIHALDTDTMEWTELTHESSVLPPPRNSHTCTVSRDGEKIIIFGGANNLTGPMNDLWSFSLTQNQWNRIVPCGGGTTGKVPEPREMHSACMNKNTDSNSILVFGGRNSEGRVCQDLWALDLDTNVWNKISETPSPRCAHSAHILSHDNFPYNKSSNSSTSTSSTSSSSSRQMLVIYGGWDGTGTIFDDCLCLDLGDEKKRWTTAKLVTSSSLIEVFHADHSVPSCRFGQASDLFENGTKFISFGGVNLCDDLQDLIAVRHQGRK